MGVSERKEREKERRKNEIIDAAEKVFFAKSYENSTMDDVAAEAELSKGTLYLYFKNREELHFSIIMRAMLILANYLRKAFDENKAGSENLLEMGKAYINFAQENEKYFESILYFDTSKFDKLGEENKLFIMGDDSPLLFFINVIEQGKNDGSIRDDITSPELAIMLWSQTTGVMDFAVKRQKLVEMLGVNLEDMMLNNFKVLLEGVNKK
jgi:AcrR family transcriptional regulator